MWSDAFAQGGAAKPADPTLAFLLQMLQFVPIFLILYLLLIRPQQQQKKMKEMLKTLKKGDRVVTTGGIIGTVIGVDESKAVLRIADDVKVEFAKSSVVQVLAEDAKS